MVMDLKTVHIISVESWKDTNALNEQHSLHLIIYKLKVEWLHKKNHMEVSQNNWQKQSYSF